MPIAFMTQTLLDQITGGRIVEPIKKNQYRLLLQISDLIWVLNSQFPDDSGYFQSISTSMVGNLYPIEVNFTPPTIQVEQRHTKGAGNVDVKYGGYVTYGESSATFHNFIGLDTYKFFYRWSCMAGLLPLQLNKGQTLIGIKAPTAPFVVPDSADNISGYKVNGTLSTYHTEDTIAGDETENSRWVLQGIFPTSVSAGDYNHADDGEPVLTSVNFSIDLALPSLTYFAS